MDPNDRPRKKLSKDGIGVSPRKSSVSRGAPSGSPKGKPVAAAGRVGLEKQATPAARRAAAETERSPGERHDLPLPMERTDIQREEARSLRLIVRVEGERITVVDGFEVDAPPAALQPVRGSSFLEVRAGEHVVALERLVDPGIAIGIPDRRDTKEFRGHRVMEQPSYELAIRVPLDVMDPTSAPADGRRASAQAPIQVSLYRATETVELDPVQLEADRAARRRLTRVAESGPLGAEEVRRASRYGNRKSGEAGA
jgi:hypothetical protein